MASTIELNELLAEPKPRKGDWEELVTQLLPNLHTLYLWGPPGVGKSYCVFQPQTEKVNLSEDLSVQELIGHYVPMGTEWRMQYGPIARAMMNGSRLIIDEIQRGSGAVLDILLGVMDDPVHAKISLTNGDFLQANTGFQVVATSNDPPDVLDPALRDRFQVKIHCKTPAKGVVRRLNALYAGLGDACRASYSDASVSEFLTPRECLAMAKLFEIFQDFEYACQLVLGKERGKSVFSALFAASVA